MTPAAAAIIARIERDLAALRDALAGDESGGNPRQPPLDPVAELRREARELGIPVTEDDCVKAADAAVLLGISVFTLRNQRNAGRTIPCRKYRGRWFYGLDDLAVHRGALSDDDETPE